MNKLVQNQIVMKALRLIKPVISALVIVLILRYTGLLSGISYLAGSALMETGVMDINAEKNRAEKTFNYDFAIKDLGGKTIDMNDFKGKVVFINLWATWCGPCRVEMPSIQELYNHVDREKVTFIMLSLDTDENQPKVVKYIADKGFSFPVYQPASQLPRQLQVSSIPTTVVIGKDGKIKMKKVGTANYATEDFQHFLEELQ
jgi:thiol-disulfide isomerase/thioredoxin